MEETPKPGLIQPKLIRWLVLLSVAGFLVAERAGLVEIQLVKVGSIERRAAQMRQQLPGKWVSQPDSLFTWEFVGDSVLKRGERAEQITWMDYELQTKLITAHLNLARPDTLRVSILAAPYAWGRKPDTLNFIEFYRMPE